MNVLEIQVVEHSQQALEDFVKQCHVSLLILYAAQNEGSQV
jgi:hypothetical protein